MSDRAVAIAQGRERLTISLLAALAIHGVVFFLFVPTLDERDATFRAPIHVSLAPLEPLPKPRDVVDESTPEPIADPVVEPVVEPAEEPVTERTPAELSSASEGGVPSEPAVGEPEPAPPAPVERSERSSDGPETSASATQELPEASRAAEPEPPPPPRQASRTFVPGADPAIRVPESLIEEEWSQIVADQAAYTALLEEYRATQADRATVGDSAPALPGQLAQSGNDIADRIAALERTLADAGEEIARVGPSDQPVSGRLGDGVSIDGPGGTRVRIDPGTPLDVSGLALPAYFPPAFPASVSISVNAGGNVVAARLTVPSGSDELDQRLEAHVRSWRFEPAPGSPVVAGSVRIIVSTRVVR